MGEWDQTIYRGLYVRLLFDLSIRICVFDNAIPSGL